MALHSYMLASGTITKATLVANSAYNVENFAKQSDQPYPALKWTEPQRKNTLRPRPARIVRLFDGSLRADGHWQWQWSFSVMTPGMLTLFETSYFSSGAVWSAAVTVQAYTDNGTYQAYNAIMERPTPGQDYEIKDGLYLDVIFRFNHGVLIT